VIASLGRLAVTRRLDLPKGVRVIGVGGSTIGGSGRTPLSIAVVDALAKRGVDVALIGHAYRAHPKIARRVSPSDALELVGDEALLAARMLDGAAPVFVAPRRADAIELAARTHRTLVVDRLLQARPAPLARSLLAVEEAEPWGSGRIFPFGNLVAPRESLIGTSDEVIGIGGPSALRVLHGAFLAGRHASIASLASLRVGLVSTIARPERVVRTLEKHGIVPRVRHFGRDHAPLGRLALARLASSARRHSLDVWLADAKTAIALPERMGASVGCLDVQLALSTELVDRLANAQPRC